MPQIYCDPFDFLQEIVISLVLMEEGVLQMENVCVLKDGLEISVNKVRSFIFNLFDYQ